MAAKDVEAGRAHVLVSIRDRFTQGLKLAEKRLKTFGSYVATSAGVVSAGVVGTLAWPLKLAADMETASVSFEVFLGSASAAKDMIEKIEKIAANTPFQFDEIRDATQMLLQFGVPAGDVLAHIQNLGDVSGGVSDKFQRLALAFGQTMAKGRLMGGEVLQMTENGFNPLAQISQMTGKSVKTLTAEMEAGAISAAMVQKAFAAAAGPGGRFNGLMAKQSQTLNGLVSTMIDYAKIAARTLGETLVPLFKQVAKVGIGAAQGITKFIQAKKELVATFGKFLVIAGTIAGLFVGIGAASLTASFLVGLIASGFAAIAGTIAFVFSPLGVFVGLIAAAGVSVWHFRSTIASSIAPMLSVFQPLIDVTKEFYKIFSDTFKGISDALQSGDLSTAAAIAMAGLQTAFRTGVDVIADLIASLIGGTGFGAVAQSLMSGQWALAASIAMASVKLEVIKAWEGIKAIWHTAVWELGSIWDDMVLGMKSVFRSTMEGIAGLVGGQFGNTLMMNQARARDDDKKQREQQRKPLNLETSEAEIQAENRLRELEAKAAALPTTTDLAIEARKDLDDLIVQLEQERESRKAEAEQESRSFKSKFGEGSASKIAGSFSAAGAVALGGKRNDAADKTATNTARLVIIAEKQLMKKGGAFT
jgi:tape measure domain-containing protein